MAQEHIADNSQSEGANSDTIATEEHLKSKVEKHLLVVYLTAGRVYGEAQAHNLEAKKSCVQSQILPQEEAVRKWAQSVQREQELDYVDTLSIDEGKGRNQNGQG